MHIVYDSKQYCVSDFRAGIELVDKNRGRSGFLAGAVATKFRSHLAKLADDNPTEELVDEFLGYYDALLNQSVTRH